MCARDAIGALSMLRLLRRAVALAKKNLRFELGVKCSVGGFDLGRMMTYADVC